MKTVREKVIEQIELQEKIQRLSGVNLVTCGNCGSILLHEINEGQIDCFACGNMMSQSDCPDYWYSGLENSEEYNKIEVNEPIELSAIGNKIDVENAKEVLKRNGYYIGSLWQTCDIKENYHCSEKQAQKLLEEVMTLKEKFYDVLPQWVNIKDAENCEQIADDFAIGFAEWVEKLRDSDIDSLDYVFWLDNTTKELLEIYKKETK